MTVAVGGGGHVLDGSQGVVDGQDSHCGALVVREVLVG